MLHYWGSKLQDYGPDGSDITRRTLEMKEMRDIWGPRIRHSLVQFGETDAFSSDTGP